LCPEYGVYKSEVVHNLSSAASRHMSLVLLRRFTEQESEIVWHEADNQRPRAAYLLRSTHHREWQSR